LPLLYRIILDGLQCINKSEKSILSNNRKIPAFFFV
jgi:hypothetical protein